MTRTDVRRHVDVNDGRVVIRKIVVETEVRETASTDIDNAPVAEHEPPRGLHRIRAARSPLTRRGVK